MRPVQQKEQKHKIRLVAFLFAVALTLGGLSMAHAASVRAGRTPGTSTQQSSEVITGTLTSAAQNSDSNTTSNSTSLPAPTAASAAAAAATPSTTPIPESAT